MEFLRILLFRSSSPLPNLRWKGIALLLCLLPSVEVEATTAIRTDEPEAVKAALYVSFMRFAKWPDSAFADADAPIRIATYGRDPCDGWLEKIAEGKSAMGRRIEVFHINSIYEMPQAHALIVPKGEDLRGSELASLGPGTLIITESPRAFKDYGMILLQQVRDRFQFEVELERIEAAQINVSSRMLSAARVVHGHRKDF